MITIKNFEDYPDCDSDEVSHYQHQISGAVCKLFGKIKTNPKIDHSQNIKVLSDWLNEHEIRTLDLECLLGSQSSFHTIEGLKITLIKALCAALKEAKTLKRLFLAQCDLRPEEIAAIDLEGTQIEHLRLGKNALSTQSILNLKPILQSRPILRLNLMGNVLDNAGIVALGKALDGSSVKVLDLRFTEFNLERAQILVPFILDSKLEEIDYHCAYGEQTQECLNQALKLRKLTPFNYGKGLNELKVILPDPLLDITAGYLVTDELMPQVKKQYTPLKNSAAIVDAATAVTFTATALVKSAGSKVKSLFQRLTLS